MRWTGKPIMWFTGKPRPLLFATFAVVQLATVAFRLATGHGVQIAGVIWLALLVFLAIRERNAQQRFPDGYPWAERWRANPEP
jgi:hypothetical protein